MGSIMFAIALVFAGCLVVIIYNRYDFKKAVQAEIISMFHNANNAPVEVVSESDIVRLPEPVQRWLRRSNVIGKKPCSTVRLKQRGYFRLKPNQKWMPFLAQEYFLTKAPEFIWYTVMKPAPMMFITGRDAFRNNAGNMLIKLLSTITVANARGPEIDQGAAVRYLNEIMWFPAAALNSYIIWEAIDERSAKATISYGAQRASATFVFSAEGDLQTMEAQRYRESDGKYSLERWSTPISAYGEFGGIRVPTQGAGIWHSENSDFSYIKLEVIDIEYDIPAVY